MKRSSAKSYRGWLVSLFVGSVITGGFFVGQYYLNQATQESYHSIRTFHPPTVPVYHMSDVARDSATFDLDPILPMDIDRTWQDYRTEPSISVSMALELAATTKLLPPKFEPSYVPNQLVLSREPGWRKPNPSKLTSIAIQSESDQVRENAADAGLRSSKTVSTEAWPVPANLMSRLQQLRDDAATRSEPMTAWCDQMIAALNEFGAISELNDERVGALCTHVGDVAQLGLQNAERISTDMFLVDRQLRLAHAINRRSMVWQDIWKCVSDGRHRLVSERAPLNFQVVAEKIERIRNMTSAGGSGKAWSDYLLLDQLTQLTQTGSVDLEQAKDLARSFLARVSWTRVTPDQRKFLASEPIKDLADEVHPMAYGPVDFRSILADIDAIEEESVHRCRISLAESVQSLRFGGNPRQVALAETINNYYRNANLRMAISSDLIQRFFPENQITQKPVRDRILGSETRGASTIKTQLKMELIPDRDAWNFILKLNGDVKSQTRSTKGPATFYNSTVAAVDTARHIRIGFDGKQIEAQKSSVAASDFLNGFDTDFDSLPIVGDLIRVVVRQQFDEQKSVAQRIVRRKIAAQADGEFDKELNKQFSRAEQEFQSKLFVPLSKMELNPVLVDMQTTERRLLARYRVAGNDQLAAHTPRPSAPSDSHLSVQIHESALNNAIDQIHFDEGSGTIQELSDKLALAMQQTPWKLAGDVPSDIVVHFAQNRPITVEFRDGKVWLTLRIDQLQQKDKMNLKKFVIVASYIPVVNGLFAELQLDGPVSVDGERLGVRERLPLRTIFAKVFAAHRTIPLVQSSLAGDKRAEGLSISQLDFHDGWLALAVSNANSPHVAKLQSATTVR
jgi:hypothetical protein